MFRTGNRSRYNKCEHKADNKPHDHPETVWIGPAVR
jgi:hypothetical protein